MNVAEQDDEQDDPVEFTAERVALLNVNEQVETVVGLLDDHVKNGTIAQEKQLSTDQVVHQPAPTEQDTSQSPAQPVLVLAEQAIFSLLTLPAVNIRCIVNYEGF